MDKELIEKCRLTPEELERDILREGGWNGQ